MDLCVAQIVPFSGKVETRHFSPEVWLPGERGGKEKGGKNREAAKGGGGLHRCDRVRRRREAREKMTRFQGLEKRDGNRDPLRDEGKQNTRVRFTQTNVEDQSVNSSASCCISRCGTIIGVLSLCPQDADRSEETRHMSRHCCCVPTDTNTKPRTLV